MGAALRRAKPAEPVAAAGPEGERVGMAPELSLGPLAGVLGYHIAQAAVATVELFERHIGQRFELRKVEFSILMLLLPNPALTPKRLGQVLALTPPNLTLLLDTTVYAASTRDGRISRVLARCDKTEHLYRITPKLCCD